MGVMLIRDDLGGARVVWEVRGYAAFGIQTAPPSVDMSMMGRAVLPSPPTSVEAVLSTSTTFRPDGGFYSASHRFRRSQAVMVLVPGHLHGEYILFCREKDLPRSCGTAGVGLRGCRCAVRCRRCVSDLRAWMTSCPVCSKSAKGCFS